MATPEREIWNKYFIPTAEGNHLTLRGPFLNFAHNSPQHPKWQKYLIKYSLIAGQRNIMNFQTCNDFFLYPTLAFGRDSFRPPSGGRDSFRPRAAVAVGKISGRCSFFVRVNDGAPKKVS